MAAVLCLVVAYRMTDPSNLAPFTYFGIPLAFGLGWAFFGQAPVDDLFPGALLIIAGGLLIVWRERRRFRAVPIADDRSETSGPIRPRPWISCDAAVA